MHRDLVPQATLERIRRVVDVIGEDAIETERIATLTGLSARHANYALSAAHSLSLTKSTGGRWTLTSLGHNLRDRGHGSEGERRTFIKAISTSELLTRVAPRLLGDKPPDRDEVAEQIASETGLAFATARHRAAMILQWRRILLDPQLPLFEERQSGMWRRIEIRNFRSIEYADVELAPFTVIVGPNGSGKSNFADALVFARDVAFDASAALSSRGGVAGVRRWRPYKPTDVALDLRAASSRANLDKNYARHSLKIHSAKGGHWSFSQERIEVVEASKTTAYLQRTAQSLKSNLLKLPGPSETASAMVLVRQLRPFAATSALRNVRRYRLNPDAMRQPQLSGERSRLDETGDNIAVAIQSLHRTRKIGQVIEAMAKIVPGLQEIYVEQAGRFLVLKFKQMQEEGAIADFNATEMSEGALRALGIIVATIQMVRDELLIVEEPEVSIHSGAAHLLFELLKEASERGAVLITTHSADLLDAARDEEILVCEYANGSTQIGPLAEAQRKVVREGLFSVAELMRSEPLRIQRQDASG